MNKKLVLIIGILTLIVFVFVLIKPEFIGEVIKSIGSGEKETIEIVDKRIRLSSTSCSDGKLTMEIINDGNATIKITELRVLVNKEEKTDNFIDRGIDPGDVISYSDSITTYSGSQYIRVEGPDNTISWGIKC